MDLNEGSKSCGKLERLLVFLSFLRRTENLIIQWALENVLIEIDHAFNIYYSGIGAN